MKTIIMRATDKYSFDFIIYIPDNIMQNSKILLSMQDGSSLEGKNPEQNIDERTLYMLEKAHQPIMIPIIRNCKDEQGNIIGPPIKSADMTDEEYTEKYYAYKNIISRYCEFEPETLIGSFPKLFEQYQSAIADAYRILFSEGIYEKDKTGESIDVEGYSAQGVKAQRLAMLIPESIRSVFVGGAISSIPIAKDKTDNLELPYPIGFANIEKIVGEERAKTIIEDYRRISQNLYVSENELQRDGKFSINGIPVSQHDKSLDVIDVVDKQVELFGNDINERVGRSNRYKSTRRL